MAPGVIEKPSRWATGAPGVRAEEPTTGGREPINENREPKTESRSATSAFFQEASLPPLRAMFASALRPSAIPDPKIRACATAIAKHFQIRTAADNGELNYREAFAALDLFVNNRDPSLLAKIRAETPSFTHDNVKVIFEYLRDGTNGLLKAGQVLLPIGEQLRQLDTYAMPPTESLPCSSEAEARTLAQHYDKLFGNRVGYDQVYLYSPTAKQLYLALNDKGKLWVTHGQNLQLVTGKDLAETLRVVHFRDNCNSLYEATIGFYADLFTMVANVTENLVSTDRLGKELSEVAAQKLTGEKPKDSGLIAKTLPMLIVTGGALATSVSAVTVSWAVVPAVVAAGLAPGAVFLVKDRAVGRDRSPILSAMGVTTLRDRTRNG